MAELPEAAKAAYQALKQLAELEAAGRPWIEAIDELAELEEHTPECRDVRNRMIANGEKLEAVFRRILALGDSPEREP
jgi:hypothetical protein